MKIAGCQLPYVDAEPERALSLVELHAAEAARAGAALVCFPECFLQGYDVSPGHVTSAAHGPSAVIDPDGAVVAQVPLLTTGMVVVDLP